MRIRCKEIEGEQLWENQKKKRRKKIKMGWHRSSSVLSSPSHADSTGLSESRHCSLSSMVTGRSSRLSQLSWQSWFWYVRASGSTLVCPCVVVAYEFFLISPAVPDMSYSSNMNGLCNGRYLQEKGIWFGLVSLFNGISTSVGYLMPNLFS